MPEYLAVTAGIIAILILLGALTIVLAQIFLFRIYTRPVRIQPRRTPADLGLSFEPLDIPTPDTVNKGWLMFPEGRDMSSRRKLVIVPHGFAAEKSDILTRCAHLCQQGYVTYTFDWRAHGESPGDVFSGGIGELDDYLAVIDYFLDQPWLQSIALYGFSFSAGLSIIAATQRQEIRCVVADSPFDRLDAAMLRILRKFPFGKSLLYPGMRQQFRKKFGADPARIDPASAAALLSPRPLLVLTGTHDRIVPHRLALRVFESTQEPKQLQVQRGGSHFDNATEELLTGVIIPFFDKHMG